MKHPIFQEDRTAQQAASQQRSMVKKLLPRAVLALIVSSLLVIGLDKWAHLSPMLMDTLAVIIPLLTIWGVSKSVGLKFGRK